MRELPATFASADDLLWQARSDRLLPFGPLRVRRTGSIGPLMEMALARFAAPRAYSAIIYEARFMQMADEALKDGAISGAGSNEVAGIFPLRRHDPNGLDQSLWDQWAKHAENIAITNGIPRKLAEALLGAMGELQDNVYAHSGCPETGLIAYAASPRSFEFVVADAGIGVLASLRQNPEFAALRDSGAALQAAAADGSSRLGRESGRGYGIGQIFRALARDRGELRFRSGDHALTISGDSPSLTGQVELAQKALLPGLVITVRCQTTLHAASSK